MKHNPFVYNVPVPADRFIGRTQQIDQILGQIAHPARISSAIYGDPRVGKTSLLHHLPRLPEEREAWGLSPTWCHFLYLDGHSIVPFSEAAFWHYVLRELERHLNDDDSLNQLIRPMVSQTSLDIFDLNSLFDQIARAGRLVVLMVDEFEWIVESLDRESPDLLYHLRARVNRPERGLALVVASRRPLEELCADIQFRGSPFDNCFSHISLPPFSQTEVDDLLLQYQVDFSDEERAFLGRTAGTQPYLVQLAGALLMRLRDRDSSFETGPGWLEQELIRETEGYFEDILSYTTEFEKMLLTWLALARLLQQCPSGQNRLGRLPQNLGRYEQDLSRLVQRGLVQRESDDQGPALFSSIFGHWVLHKILGSAGREALAKWPNYYVNFLTPVQQSSFKELVQVAIERPEIFSRPELLEEFLSQPGRPPSPPSPVTPSIRLSGAALPADAQKIAVIKHLYLQTGHHIAQVHLEQELQGGLSGAQVILAQPIDNRSRGLAYEVLKIAPSTMLRREHSRYRQFVKGRLPATAVRLENGPVELDLIGCLSYGFAGDRPVGTIKDLESYYATREAGEIIETLNSLMEPLDDRWYSQSVPLATSFDEEYGRQLPAHLKLRTDRILPGDDFSSPSHRVIDLQTILDAQQSLKVGEGVAITGLQVDQVMPKTVKLHSVGDGNVIWVRAEVATPYPHLKEKDRVTVLGAIEARRDDVLTAAVTNIFNFTSTIRLSPGEGLRLEGLTKPSPHPLAIYKQILGQQLHGRKTIIHGDLHPGNILVDESGRAWIIDFDHVREAHVLFDFVRFETLFRLFVLGGVRRLKRPGQILGSSDFTPPEWPHSFTLAEYAAFETSLVQQTLGLSAGTITQPDLAKAAQVIMAVRELARPYLRRRDNWREYLTGLFLQNLAQLRFYQEQPWLGALPFTTATIVADEVSGRAG